MVRDDRMAIVPAKGTDGHQKETDHAKARNVQKGIALAKVSDDHQRAIDHAKVNDVLKEIGHAKASDAQREIGREMARSRATTIALEMVSLRKFEQRRETPPGSPIIFDRASCLRSNPW